jgi:CHRD domain-containing protein
VYRVKRLAGVVFGAALLASLALGGSAIAQGTQSAQVQLTPSRDSGVSGTATFTDVEGRVEVELTMRGLPEAGVEHINHIHGGGTCADDRAGRTAPVTIPLKTVVAKDDGTGSATTTIKDVSVEELFGEDEERFILLHAKTKEGQGVPPGIACADLVRTSGNGISTSRLPQSGGTSPVVLLSIVALSALSAGVGLLVLRRSLA